MIISASRRCDIPNYMGDWFYDGIKKREIVISQTPFAQKRISLNPEIVDCIVFWTKNPEPMILRLSELQDYMFYFQFTLTGYSNQVEPGVPDKHYMIEVFKKLSSIIGSERVIWRYDPIFINDIYTVDYHKKAFYSIASSLAGYTRRCVISFVDIYGKLTEKAKKYHIQSPTLNEIHQLAEYMGYVANAYHIQLQTCAEKYDLKQFGIGHTHCIDAELISYLTGKPIFQEKDLTQRKACGCCASIDIGTYHTCKNNCIYCYAN